MATKTLQFENPRIISQLIGTKIENFAKIESAFQVQLATREGWIDLTGADAAITQATDFINLLNLARKQGLQIRSSDFDNILVTYVSGKAKELKDLFENPELIQVRDHTIIPKTINQKKYVQSIKKHEIVFGIGPAGTGKTYLAVAAALEALMQNQVQKIILTRPAIEAGEALGFLPGDLLEKISPYLRPLYDAIYEIVGFENGNRLIEKNVIEVAPLAYMRGRTLSQAYVILDEAQNTSPEQMMMFLTRMGDNSRLVITGDITQIDLPHYKISGLRQAIAILDKVEEIKFFYFDKTDVVRHNLVQKIIQAYEVYREQSAVEPHKE